MDFANLFCGIRFPHLYRCGHIEGEKLATKTRDEIYKFPHLYRCGHIEGREGGDEVIGGFDISASL